MKINGTVIFFGAGAGLGRENLMGKLDKVFISAALSFFLLGCATLSQNFQPSPEEKYGIIKAQNGIFFESIDDQHFGLGIYGYKGDIRVYPGTHEIEMHYDSPGILLHYSGRKLPLTIYVKEGIRYYIGAELTRNKKFFNTPETWKPVVTTEEEIEGYWESHS